MQCEKCSEEVKTTGFRWSFRVECKSCGALYESLSLHQPAAASWKKKTIAFTAGAACVSLIKYGKEYFVGHEFEMYAVAAVVAFLILSAIYLQLKKPEVQPPVKEAPQWKYLQTRTPEERKQDAVEQWMFVVVFGSLLLLSIVLFKLAY
jgi:hypothetical protein